MIRRFLFGWVFAAFRAAVRREVEAALADRRRTFAEAMPPVSAEEIETIRASIRPMGLRLVEPCRPRPLPVANDRHRQDPPPPNLIA